MKQRSFASLISAGFVCLAGMLVACVTAPINPQEVVAPAANGNQTLTATQSDLDSDAWAARFGDATLNRLIDEALEANLGLEAAEAKARAAEAAARISGALRYPGVNLGLNSARQQSRFSFLNFQEIEIESHSLSLGSQWELDVWGRLGKAHAAGLAQYEAALADVDALRLSIAGQVAKAWFNILELDQQLKLAEDSAQSLERKLDSLGRRYDRGLITGLDLRLTRAQAASSRSLVQQRRNQLDNAKRALEVLLGRYPTATQSSDRVLPEIVFPIPPDLPSSLVERRPDLYASERRLAASLAQSESAQRNWLPQFRLTGSAGTTSDQFKDLLDTNFSVWTLAGEVAGTLFSAGRLKGERDQAKALADAQLAQFRSEALNAFQEVERALASESDLAQLEKDTAVAAYENQKAEELAWEQYSRGLIDITSLLDAQRRADESASQLLSIKNQRLQNRINLHLAIGGDFE